MDSCNIYVHFELMTVDPGLIDEAVDALQVNGTIAEVIRNDDVRNVEEFPWFVVKPEMKRAFFQHDIFCITKAYGDQRTDVS